MRISKRFIGTSIALGLLVTASPLSASAQSLGDAVGGLADSLGGAVGGVTDGIGGAVGGVTGDSGFASASTSDGGFSASVGDSSLGASTSFGGLSTSGTSSNTSVNFGSTSLTAGTTGNLSGGTLGSANIGVASGLLDGTGLAGTLGSVSLGLPGIASIGVNVGTTTTSLTDDTTQPGKPAGTNTARMVVASLSTLELAKLKLTCSKVLMNPGSFGNDMVRLCQLVRSAR